MIYSTEPGVVLLGFVSVWLMVFPDPALAPVIPPVMVPMVQVKVLAVEAVRDILVLVPLQILFVELLVTTGVG
jgi:hypothetical protein